MTEDHSFWYRLGYEVETVRQRLARGLGRLEPGAPELRLAGTLTSAGLTLLASRFLAGGWKRRARARPRWLRAAAAGGGAAILARAARSLLPARTREDGGADLVGALLEGVGDGLLYAAFIEPRVPGPAAVQGAVYGVLDYATAPYGGLPGVLRTAAPSRAVALVARALQGDGVRRTGSLPDHLLFGLALALLYGSSRARSGMTELVEETRA